MFFKARNIEYNSLINLVENSNVKKNSIFCDATRTYINRAFVCDHQISYPDSIKSLKIYCFEENLSKFKCKNNNKTISHSKVCNYINDCEDKSDEINCGNENFFKFFQLQQINLFRKKNMHNG